MTCYRTATATATTATTTSTAFRRRVRRWREYRFRKAIGETAERVGKIGRGLLLLRCSSHRGDGNKRELEQGGYLALANYQTCFNRLMVVCGFLFTVNEKSTMIIGLYIKEIEWQQKLSIKKRQFCGQVCTLKRNLIGTTATSDVSKNPICEKYYTLFHYTTNMFYPLQALDRIECIYSL